MLRKNLTSTAKRSHQDALIDYLSVIPDPRVVGRSDHLLIDILIIVIYGTLCGMDSWTEIEDFANLKETLFRRFLELPNGIPSHDTLSRVFAVLSPEAFGRAFSDWVQEFKEQIPGEVVGIDGKFIRAALRKKGQKRSAIGIVSAWATRSGLVLGQRKTELKKEQGEKRATEELLKFLNIQGCIISMDANGATPRLVTQITQQGGDYNIALKDNQRVLRKYAERAFTKHPPSSAQIFVTEEKGHGRQEKRAYEQIPVKDLDLSISAAWPKARDKWAQLSCFGRVTSERRSEVEGKPKVQVETRYYFTSLKEDVEKWGRATREHWGVENALHRTLDVTFGEDQNRTRAGHAAENLALVRKMVLNLLKINCQEKKSIQRKRLRCSLDDAYAFKILTGGASV